MRKPGGWVGSTRKERLPPDWAKRKAAVRARDGDICYLCGLPGADTIDHKVPGDNHELWNLAPVHDRNPPHCHRRKSSAEGHAAQRLIRAKGRMPVEPHPGLKPTPAEGRRPASPPRTPPRPTR